MCMCLNLVTRVTLHGNAYDECYDCGRVSSNLSIDDICKMMIYNLVDVKYIFHTRDILYEYLNRYVYSVLYHVLKKIEPKIRINKWRKNEIIEYIINIVFQTNMIKSAMMD